MIFVCKLWGEWCEQTVTMIITVFSITPELWTSKAVFTIAYVAAISQLPSQAISVETHVRGARKKYFEILRLWNGIFNTLNEIFLWKNSTWIRCKMTGTNLVLTACTLYLNKNIFPLERCGGGGAPPAPQVCCPWTHGLWNLLKLRNFCFLRGPLRWLTAAKNTSVIWLLNFRVHMFLESTVIAENNNRLGCFVFSLVGLYTKKGLAVMCVKSI